MTEQVPDRADEVYFYWQTGCTICLRTKGSPPNMA